MNLKMEKKRQKLKMKGHEETIWKRKVNNFLKINKYNMKVRRELKKE
jgi:hypothetical protein